MDFTKRKTMLNDATFDKLEYFDFIEELFSDMRGDFDIDDLHANVSARTNDWDEDDKSLEVFSTINFTTYDKKPYELRAICSAVETYLNDTLDNVSECYCNYYDDGDAYGNELEVKLICEYDLAE